ncbi:MAG: PD-(D/E)XK nuclease family protein [Candidatus Protistobacter heckmanni]|nr:PD-(D/E)XK nuclease family protein [Candidatus Protistobacter heckmanni]
MTQYRFPAGPGFAAAAAAAARAWLAEQGGEAGPQGRAGEASPVFLLPTPAQIPAFRKAWTAALGPSAAGAFLPRITTLAIWQQDLPPLPGDPAPRSVVSRLLEIRQALKEQAWLRGALGAESKTGLWSLAQSIVAVCDELSEVWLPEMGLDPDAAGKAAVRKLEGALERVYARLHRRILGEEAQLVLVFWKLLSTPADPLALRWRLMQRLAAGFDSPVVWIDPVEPGPMEAGFLALAAQRVPVCRVHCSWATASGGEAAQALRPLLDCWPELGDAAPAFGCGPVSDASAAASAGRRGAKAFADQLDLFGAFDAVGATCVHSDAGEAAPDSASAKTPVFPDAAIVAARGFEEEAWLAAGAIIGWLNAGLRDIALVAQDRVVAHRVRALLARANVPVRDETDWKLSTTRAASAVMSWLDALGGAEEAGDAAPVPDVGALLDWLKSPFVLADLDTRSALTAMLERAARRYQVAAGWGGLRRALRTEARDMQRSAAQAAQRGDASFGTPFDAQADTQSGAQSVAQADAQSDAPVPVAASSGGIPDLHALLDRLQSCAARWSAGAKTLDAWCALLDDTLDHLGMRGPLAADEAGAQLLDVIDGLRGDVAQAQAETGRQRFSISDFRALLSLLFESAGFREAAVRAQARVTILPLSRTRLRAFEAAAMVGCTEAGLPAPARETLFFSSALRRELGLPDREAARRQQARDLAGLLLETPRAQLSWQQHGASGELQRVSGWLARMCLQPGLLPTGQLQGRGFAALRTAARPGGMPAPAAPALLPLRISAAAYQSLRNCPYQFFITRMLGLRPLDDIKDKLEKRDIGEWLHAILLAYHQQLCDEGEGWGAARREAALLAQSEAVFLPALEQDGAALPWWLRWRKMIPSYVDWQMTREREGWRWRDGEVAVTRPLGLEDGDETLLHGRIDRIETRGRAEAGPGFALLDYKTQALHKLRARAKLGGEDVQLPFYALLVDESEQGGPSVDEAGWVALDGDAAGMQPLPDLREQAASVRHQLVRDLSALKRGAPLPAWGDASACRYCEVQGLCRKRYWPAPTDAGADKGAD